MAFSAARSKGVISEERITARSLMLPFFSMTKRMNIVGGDGNSVVPVFLDDQIELSRVVPPVESLGVEGQGSVVVPLQVSGVVEPAKIVGPRLQLSQGLLKSSPPILRVGIRSSTSPLSLARLPGAFVRDRRDFRLSGVLGIGGAFLPRPARGAVFSRSATPCLGRWHSGDRGGRR